MDDAGERMAASAVWADVFAEVADRSHLATGDQLSVMVDHAVAPLGLTAEVMLVNLAQRALVVIRPGHDERIDVEATLTGRAFQLGELIAGTGPDGERLLLVPMLDGTERVGVLRLGLPASVVDDARFRARCWSLAGLVGHIVMIKVACSDRLRRLRSDSALSTAAELLWQLVPPRTFATDRVVVTALLEPWDQVAGDAYDYAVDEDVVDLAVFDGVGHDLSAGLSTALALTAIRNARRAHVTGLVELAGQADRLLVGRPGPTRFVTAVLARLDTRTGVLDYLVAGHPPPLLVRDGRIVKELDAPVGPPLGVPPAAGRAATQGREQLEPDDRLLLYSDGIVEARDPQGAFFGVERLVDLTERTEMSRVSAPETLRRLTAAVLEHQAGELQDDATLVMVDWSTDASDRMLRDPH
ncbi:PP2C family protein-serine/threonine phosphatase [Actinomycetospora atypica]|uniref:PP2C family protein-serine/threonine phosphatase n=1 Tax=Actinomycetospora atypica TaxID=1290095 RepID=A0ABV9YMY6_9PSEU